MGIYCTLVLGVYPIVSRDVSTALRDRKGEGMQGTLQGWNSAPDDLRKSADGNISASSYTKLKRRWGMSSWTYPRISRT